MKYTMFINAAVETEDAHCLIFWRKTLKSITTTAPVSQTRPNQPPSNHDAPYFLTDFWDQSRPALLPPLLPLRGGVTTLFGGSDLIWSAARGAAALRGSLLVTLSPNCSVDCRRWDGQSEGEARNTRAGKRFALSVWVSFLTQTVTDDHG